MHKEEAWGRGDFFQLKSPGVLVLPAYFLGWVVVSRSMARNNSYIDKKCKTSQFNNLSHYFSSKNYQKCRQYNSRKSYVQQWKSYIQIGINLTYLHKAQLNLLALPTLYTKEWMTIDMMLRPTKKTSWPIMPTIKTKICIRSTPPKPKLSNCYPKIGSLLRRFKVAYRHVILSRHSSKP